jgi:uncharacterized repeat protein (TIGR03803 family)
MTRKNIANTQRFLAKIVALSLCMSATLAAAQTEGILHSFAGGTLDGSVPYTGLIADSSGSLYGTTDTAGPNGYGTVFQLVPPSGGGTWTENILYSFSNGSDGATPVTNLVMDSADVIYGATGNAGAFNCGTFFQLVPPTGGGAWTENTLYNFPCAFEGGISGPGSIARDPSTGIIYGTVQNGGPFNGGWIYKMVPPASGGTWTNTVLHNFTTNPSAPGYANGCVPWTLILGPNGGLFGTASYCGVGGGTVYRLTPPTGSGTSWNFALLYSFGSAVTSPNGYNPYGLVFGKGGVLYGTTTAGGGARYGTVYSLTPSGTGSPWNETIIHDFTGSPDGNYPLSGVILGPAGSLYGTTAGGGLSNTTCGAYPGCGTVFQLTPGSSGWTETILHNFAPTGGDAINPNPGPLLQRGGNLYGVSYLGGASNDGAVYAVHP